jgi:hypothetical protein
VFGSYSYSRPWATRAKQKTENTKSILFNGSLVFSNYYHASNPHFTTKTEAEKKRTTKEGKEKKKRKKRKTERKTNPDYQKETCISILPLNRVST